MRQHATIHQEAARAAQRSSGELFEQVMREQSAPLFHYISRFVNDYDAASDICQQVFIQLYTFLPSLRTDRPLTAWLFHVARNYCIDEARRKRAICFSELEGDAWHRADEEELSLLHLLPDLCPTPAEETEQHDLQQCLCEAIRALPPKFRAVVSLRYTADMSYAEIGARLHIPPSTAKTYFQRAKPLLRRLLMGQGISAVA
ncbi:MAG TPA: sigma-70 family RNA polymerase sigma factor [Ktedonobacterales bacterium]|jgi:RNA polymerase sigma-70 factor (ECF subfamily)